MHEALSCAASVCGLKLPAELEVVVKRQSQRLLLLVVALLPNPIWFRAPQLIPVIDEHTYRIMICRSLRTDIGVRYQEIHKLLVYEAFSC